MGSDKPKVSRLLGIDFGLRRLGLALSDERKIIAMPLMTLQCEKKSEATVSKLKDLISSLQITHNCEIEAIVIGLPLMMNGTCGLLADEVKHFIALIQKSISILQKICLLICG